MDAPTQPPGRARSVALATRAAELRARLALGPELILDGALGTELERRGVRSELPLWSAHALLEAPAAVLAIHEEYAEAGCHVLTANTFRTQRRTLARAGLGAEAARLTHRAVSLARTAAARAPRGDRPFVVGSVAPLEDCYRPDLVPEDAALVGEHTEHVGHLADAGAEGLWVETMNTVREAAAAVQAARASGLPTVASFVCDGSARLLSGEPLARALEAALDAGADAVAVNCIPPSAVPACLAVLGSAAHAPFGLWPNLGEPGASPRDPRTEELSPEAFAHLARACLAAGARMVGGCCGTTPAHLRALAAGLR